MKLLIMQFSSTPCHFISLWTKYFLQYPVLKHPQFQKAVILFILGLRNDTTSISYCKLLLSFAVLSQNLFGRMYGNHNKHQDSWSPVRDMNLEVSIYKA
jgi:hypothetical protein